MKSCVSCGEIMVCVYDVASPRCAACAKIVRKRMEDADSLADRDRRIEALTKALQWADDWIGGAPHGDNCYVSNHYEGDPGNQCNCGKESLLEALASAAGAEGKA